MVAFEYKTFAHLHSPQGIPQPCRGLSYIKGEWRSGRPGFAQGLRRSARHGCGIFCTMALSRNRIRGFQHKTPAEAIASPMAWVNPQKFPVDCFQYWNS